jgi:ABC-type transport system involved in cytochrome c biogenesis permease component
MSRNPVLSGLVGHFRLTLRLNFRSTQALVYGYLVPLFFLLAFGSVFRADTPPLLNQMGQLLTITLLGGACFGLPTALVAERERGVWRRYRLLPVPTGSLVLGTLLARLVLVGSAVVLQILLARLIYGTPFPLHPGQTLVALLCVALPFLGLGLLIAALADDVPAVQALGQCLFLPMIMIGGVGVPLTILPLWAQRVAGFMPGRYAVDLLQHAYLNPAGLRGTGFSILALAVIGAAAGVAGARLFRWDGGRRISRSALGWLAVALLSWVAIGLAATVTGRLQPALPPAAAYESITDEQAGQITYDDLPGDNELVTRLAPPFDTDKETPFVSEFAAKLKAWPPGLVANPAQRVRNLLSVAAIADISADLREAEIGRIVFDELQGSHKHAELRRMLAWIILHPDEGLFIQQAQELGLLKHPPEPLVRERSLLYAKKYLGRMLGKLRD